MPKPTNYTQFSGYQRDTAEIHNILAYQGVVAPHTNSPLSEALLFGISGGIVAGYFVFEYKGHMPSLHFINRNSFDPMQTILERLNIEVNSKGTSSEAKAVRNLLDALENDQPAIVWATYNAMPYRLPDAGTEDESYTLPLVVYGYNEESDTVYIADGSLKPLTMNMDTLTRARGHKKSEKYRIMTLNNPSLDNLPEAVKAGIQDAINNMLGEAPLKPMRGKFGLHAFTRWSEALNDPSKKGWAQQFASGERMVAMLKSAYHFIHLYGTGGHGARGVFADFLNEAAIILKNTTLNEVALKYRDVNKLWEDLNLILLPDEVPLLKETRELMQKDAYLFRNDGMDSLEERKGIKIRLAELEKQAQTDFPLSDADAQAFRERLSQHLLTMRDAEETAMEALQDAMH